MFNLTAKRLHSFVIEIFSQNPKGCPTAFPGVCYNHTGSGLPVGQTTISCDQPMWGRFVRVRKWHVINKYDVLTLCEMEVYSSAKGMNMSVYQVTCFDKINYKFFTAIGDIIM